MSGQICCPGCGTELVVKRLANSTHTCHCPADDCRAEFMTHAHFAGKAADKFVEKCEQYGYTTALNAKIETLIQNAESPCELPDGTVKEGCVP